jgi:hypothetical protein
VCRYCALDLRALWITEVEAVASDAHACARARATAEREGAERLAAEDRDDAGDGRVD